MIQTQITGLKLKLKMKNARDLFIFDDLDNATFIRLDRIEYNVIIYVIIINKEKIYIFYADD